MMVKCSFCKWLRVVLRRSLRPKILRDDSHCLLSAFMFFLKTTLTEKQTYVHLLRDTTILQFIQELNVVLSIFTHNSLA